MFRYGVGIYSRTVCDYHSVTLCRFKVEVIHAGTDLGNDLELRCRSKGLLRPRLIVGHYRVNVLYGLNEFLLSVLSAMRVHLQLKTVLTQSVDSGPAVLLIVQQTTKCFHFFLLFSLVSA